MSALTSYLAIGAVFVGVGIGTKSERCGEFQTPDPLDVISMTIAWPAIVVSVVFYDYEITPSLCANQ